MWQLYTHAEYSPQNLRQSENIENCDQLIHDVAIYKAVTLHTMYSLVTYTIWYFLYILLFLSRQDHCLLNIKYLLEHKDIITVKPTAKLRYDVDVGMS